RIALGFALATVLLGSPGPTGLLEPVHDGSAGGEESSRQAELYDQGTDALDAGQWDRAAAGFAETARAPGDRADGALYWRAYAQNKLGRRSDALATLQQLKTRFPKSRWSNDAAALELELRGARNVAPESVDDEELKLIALNS